MVENKFVKWLIRMLPSKKSLAQNPLLRPFKNRFLSPELWRFTRRSVPVGVAIGFLTAIIVVVPGFQIFVAVLICSLFRANIPVAVVATFINTPITTFPLLIAAWLLGLQLMGENSAVSSQALVQIKQIKYMNLSEFGSWLMSAGQPMLIGLFAIAVVTAAVGYLLTSWLWTRWIFRKYRRRSKTNVAGR